MAITPITDNIIEVMPNFLLIKISINIPNIIPYAMAELLPINKPIYSINIINKFGIIPFILNHAKKYVHIMTPYLILDNETITTLTYAAKCGIEVVIIMPHIPDKWYAFALAHTYYEELMDAGVQIYEYTPGFVHAKVLVSDDDTAVVGTVNLDYRSFYHHFECGAFIYANPVVRDVEQDFEETLAKCQKMTKEDLKSRSIWEKMCGKVLRLIAPLM